MAGFLFGQNEPTLRLPLSRGIGGSLSFSPLRAGFLLCAALRAINQSSHENEKGEPVDEFAFVFARRLVAAVMPAAKHAVMRTLPDALTRARPDLTSTLPVRP
jgi:hypothetical protein